MKESVGLRSPVGSRSLGLGMAVVAFAMMAGAALAAGPFHVSQMGVSPYADTEVSTNISLRSTRTDVVKFDLRFQLDGTPTNNLSLCFGRDVNTNGVLEVDDDRRPQGR